VHGLTLDLSSVWQLLRAVLLQHTMQTILGLLWLAPESEIQKTQVFVDHAARLAETYAPWVIRLTSLAIGPRNAVALLSAGGGEVGRRMVEFSYWWAYPILQFAAAL
jgi:sphinganine C4-monooxygenase